MSSDSSSSIAETPLDHWRRLAGEAVASRPTEMCDDGALMATCEDGIDWILEKAAISRDTGKLALLSMLMSIRERSGGRG